MHFKPLTLVVALAASAAASPTLELNVEDTPPSASPSASASASPSPPPVDVSGFTAKMKVNKQTNKCYIELNMPGIGCTGSTGDFIEYGSSWPDSCWVKTDKNPINTQFVCGSASGALWVKDVFGHENDPNSIIVKKGVYSFMNPENQNVDFAFHAVDHGGVITIKPESTGVPSPAS